MPAALGRGFVENKHSTVVESTSRVRASVCLSTHPEGKSCGLVPSRCECLFSLTLLLGQLTAMARLDLRGNPHLSALPDAVSSLQVENGGICVILNM